MPHYLLQASYTPEAWATIVKNPQKRREAIRPMIEEIGGRIEYFFAFGEDKVFFFVEVPDDVNPEALATAIAAGGDLKSVPTPVRMTPEEAIEAMRRASGVAL